VPRPRSLGLTSVASHVKMLSGTRLNQMAHGAHKRISGNKMSSLQFMNQDGEWENFPTDSELAEKAKHQELLNSLQVRIICHLCNEPVPREELAFWVQGTILTWSCKKCHAVNVSK
jgi:hypothetical protein